jgi:serine protease SohB
LRREVTAVVQNADPWDSVVVLLKSEGGEVSSYGLAAAQLERIKV